MIGGKHRAGKARAAKRLMTAGIGGPSIGAALTDPDET